MQKKFVYFRKLQCICISTVFIPFLLLGREINRGEVVIPSSSPALEFSRTTRNLHGLKKSSYTYPGQQRTGRTQHVKGFCPLYIQTLLLPLLAEIKQRLAFNEVTQPNMIPRDHIQFFKGQVKAVLIGIEAAACSHRCLLTFSKRNDVVFNPLISCSHLHTTENPFSGNHSVKSAIISSLSNNHHFFRIFHVWTDIFNTGHRFTSPQGPQSPAQIRTQISTLQRSSYFFHSEIEQQKSIFLARCYPNIILVSQVKFCFHKSKFL